jgi:hypothetical protein
MFLTENFIGLFVFRYSKYTVYICGGTNNNNCDHDLEHIYNWIELLIYLYNVKIRNNIIIKIEPEVVLR